MRKFLFPILMIILVSKVPAQMESIWPKLESRLDSLYANLGNSSPGCAISVVKNGETVLKKGYGMANLEQLIPFTPSTVSDIGSVAKQFTAFAIVLLAQDGKLMLDDDIRKHLNYVPDFDNVIRISNLIHHTSGIREVYGTMSMAGYRGGDGIKQEDAKMLLENSKDLNFNPGERYLYCNTAYMMLADIISRESGQQFEEFMRMRVFEPLGMMSTYIMDHQGELFPNCADSYSRGSDGIYLKQYDNSAAYGQGGIYTTNEDLAKWLRNFKSHEVGGMNVWQQMLKRGTLNNGDTLDYAHGLTINERLGIKQISHGGASAGYRALLSYFPEHELGVVINANSPIVNQSGAIDVVLRTVVAELVEDAQTDSGPDEDSEIKWEPSEGELQAITGSYFSPELETVYTILLEQGQLKGRHRRHGTFTLQPASENELIGSSFFRNIRIIWENGTVAGLRAGNGRVLEMWFEKMK